jgi:hypothetical protein
MWAEVLAIFTEVLAKISGSGLAISGEAKVKAELMNGYGTKKFAE